jgi:hypothetical protein
VSAAAGERRRGAGGETVMMVTRLRRLRASAADFLRYRALYRLWRLVMLAAAPFGTATLYVMYRKDLTRPITPYRARVPVEVTRAAPDEIEAVARIESADEAFVRMFRNRARRGQMCFVARVNGEVVACDWVCPRPEAVPGGVAALRPGEVYCTDAYTVPAWRGRNIHPELNSRMLIAAQEAGYRIAYTLTNVVNPRSWKVAFRAGWEFSGTYIYFRSSRTGRERIWRLAGSIYPCVPLSPGRRPSRGGAVSA